MSDCGVLVVGYAGNTASTLIGTLALLDAGVLNWRELPSSVEGYITAPPPRRVCCGGWEVRPSTVDEAIREKRLIPNHLLGNVRPMLMSAFSGIGTALDYFDGSPDRTASSGTHVGELAAAVAADVRAFTAASGVERPIIIYLGSPARKAEPALDTERDPSALQRRGADTVPASAIYAAGAIDAGADFVDFTPSEGLTAPALWYLAEERGTQLVGRDGSTGQTMLKAAIASMLRLRGFPLRSWFSSNHLGNSDGLVLAEPGFKLVKARR